MADLEVTNWFGDLISHPEPLGAYNRLCSDRGGDPLLNQNLWFDPGYCKKGLWRPADDFRTSAPGIRTGQPFAK